MVRKIQAKKLSKTVNNKNSFKKFVESNYSDLDLFIKSCKGSEDLLIYTCLSKDELLPYIEKIKNIEDIDKKLKYLKDNQPFMNETEARYEKCIESIAMYLKNYIAYNGFVMNNGSGDAEDWTSEFWLKYTKICNFYRDRWFHPEALKRSTTVTYNLMQYKEFVYICRMSITGERRHQAFLATQHPDSTIFKPSLDFKMDSKNDNEKTMMDVVKDPYSDSELSESKANVSMVLKKALDYAKNYENGKYFNKISQFYVNQDASDISDRKIITLGKVFLYKAGLVSPKILLFIKSLSSKYKAKFNISVALLNKQISEYKKKKTIKTPSYTDILEDGGKTRIGLILRKRGTTDPE